MNYLNFHSIIHGQMRIKCELNVNYIENQETLWLAADKIETSTDQQIFSYNLIYFNISLFN